MAVICKSEYWNISTQEHLSDKPIFFGHYWLKGAPVLQRSNLCCLDYSVAKGGKLVGYRVGKEGGLDKGRLVGV